MANTDKNGKSDNEGRDTERVIVKRERALVLPEEITDEQIKALQSEIRKADKSPGSGLLVEAWHEVARTTGSSKRTAIEAYAGKPGTPDAKPGVFKAPSASAWNGGEVYDRPPEPKVERRALED